MIVSGFTEKNVKEEHLHGSPLDHPHCATCVKRACRVTVDSVTSCDVIDCPRGCYGRYHSCKEMEHLLLCPEERVACINSTYGCPAFLRRRKLAEHLKGCPASVVFCSAQWNRCALEPARPGEIPPVLMKKMYADCGQLDMALAMRDHRTLIDVFLAPWAQKTGTMLQAPQTQACPAAPLGHVYSSVQSDMTDAGVSGSSEEADGGWDSQVLQVKKAEVFKAEALKVEASSETSLLYDVSRQTATTLTSTLSYISDQIDSLRGGIGGASCEEDSNSAAVSAKNEKSPSPSNEGGPRLAVTTSSSEEISMFLDDKQELMIRDKQALNRVISLNLSVECIARCQPKTNNIYTFLCAQDIRRDEFPHHFHTVHDCIQSDLSGWMEQRCPLAYLGCPFSFRRFRPNLPGMTICHSWLLESFGLTCLGSQDDCSHQTPSHLMPTSAEMADSHSTSVDSDGSLQATRCTSNDSSLQMNKLQTSHGQNEGLVQSLTQVGHNRSLDGCLTEQNKSIEQRPAEQDQAKSIECSLADVDQEASSASSHIDGHLATSPSEIQRQVSSTPSVSRQVSQTPESPAKILLPNNCPQDLQSANDSFSAQLNSISLEKTDALKTPPSTSNKVKQNQGFEIDAVSISGQAADASVQNCVIVNDSPQNLSSEQSHCDQLEGVATSLSTSPNLTSTHYPPGVNQSQSVRSLDDSHPVREKQVIFTGTSANSCVRVDIKTTALLKTNSEDSATESLPATQLSDLPVEILRYISQFLDSFSLCNLSLVSRGMRELCCSLLQDRGVVSLVWEKQQQEDRVVWRAVGKCWSFSRCFDPVESWSFSGDNPISSHLQTCPYNQDRVRHTDKFSIISVCETPLNIQIRDMLQDLLQRRRDFRGWIIWSNFEREHITEARPIVGPLADVLVALGGTLPQ